MSEGEVGFYIIVGGQLLFFGFLAVKWLIDEYKLKRDNEKYFQNLDPLTRQLVQQALVDDYLAFCERTSGRKSVKKFRIQMEVEYE